MKRKALMQLMLLVVISLSAQTSKMEFFKVTKVKYEYAQYTTDWERVDALFGINSNQIVITGRHSLLLNYIKTKREVKQNHSLTEMQVWDENNSQGTARLWTYPTHASLHIYFKGILYSYHITP